MAIRRLGMLIVLLGVAGLVRADVARETSLARMQADMQFLTSDECEGRGPGTAGIEKAADRIAGAFKEAGLKGAMPDGSYFQPFTVRGPSRVGKSEMSIWGSNGVALKLNSSDFITLGASGSGTISGDLVFVGHSVVSDKVPYDDYAGIDVAGKVAVMLRRCPRYAGTGDKKFGEGDAAVDASSLATKIANAEKHKAVAVILVNDRTTLSESKDALMPFSATRSASAAKIPCVHLHRDVAELLFRRAFGKSVEQMEDAIDKDLKPMNGPMKGMTADFDVVVERDRKIPTKNVVGVLEGKGPLANETVIVGAHYDHLGYGGSGSLDRSSKSAIHHGADDNASGSTSIIELARRFGAMKDRVGRRLVFMTFSGEEMGLLGSAHYCKEPIFPLENTTVMVNLDMVGRLVADKETNMDKLEIGGLGSAKQFDAMMDKYNEKYKFKLKKTPAGMGPSDHQSFFLKKLPVLFFFTGLHPDYHRPSDTWDKINYAGMVKIADMCEEIVVDLAAREEKLEFVNVSGSMNPTMQTTRAKVRIGALPEYNDDKEGVLLQGASPDSPADKAGLKEGDRIVEFAGQPVKNLSAYMELLGKCEPGKAIDVVILRKGEKITVQVTPEKPKE
jgi:Peptidase family M28/PDZ domain/PA domain